MGLSATWTITCDNCAYVENTTLTPEQHYYNNQGDKVHFWYSDPWGLGIPHGWLQAPYDKITDRRYLFFCCLSCLQDWLLSQNRIDEAHKLQHVTFIA